MYLQYGKLYKLTKNNLDTLQKSVIITKKSLTISKGFAIVNLLGSRGEFIKNGGGGLLFFMCACSARARNPVATGKRNRWGNKKTAHRRHTYNIEITLDESADHSAHLGLFLFCLSI